MLTQISVENFKSLRHLDLRLKPLTIFIGPNGSGKSSILHSILILKKLYATQGNASRDGLFQLNGYLDMGSWDDVAFDRDMPTRISMDIDEGSVGMLLNTSISRDGRISLNIRLRIEDSESTLGWTSTLPYAQRQLQNITIRLKTGALSISWDGFSAHITSTSGDIPEGLKTAIISMLTSWYHKVLFIPSAFSMFRIPQTNVTLAKDAILNNIKTSLIINEQQLASLISLDPDVEEYVLRNAEKIFGIRIRSHTFHPHQAQLRS